MLMPAGVLIVLALAAISFDLSVVFLRQRQASATAADVANDLATAALDVEALRATGTYRLDPQRARTLGEELVQAADVGAHLVALEVDVEGDDTVTVRVVLHVDYVFAKAIPGARGGTDVEASSTARAVIS